jgi:hypothetical protein
MRRMTMLILLSFAALIAANLAHAEGCEEGQQHPPSAKEKAYYSSEFKTLRNALPKPPAGWQYSDADKEKLEPAYTDVPEWLCGANQNYYIGLDMGYERPVSEADQAKLDAAMQAKPDPAKQKELEDLMGQQQAMIQKQVAAAQKQDYKAMDAVGKQSDALNAKISKVQEEMNARQSAAMTALQWDREAKVHIAINDAGDVTCYGDPKPLQVTGGVAYQCGSPATFSSPGNQLDPAKGHIIVVFGKGVQPQTDTWDRQDSEGKEHQDSYVILKYTSQYAATPAVQFVSVDVEGDDLARAQSLFKQMDLAPLAALIKK